MTESTNPLVQFKGWCDDYQDKPAYKVVKYTVITLVAIAAVALITTSLVGMASLVGGGLLPHTFLGALNTHLISAWGGLPIFMNAAGSPGYLLALGLLIYGVYACTKTVVQEQELQNSVGEPHEHSFSPGDFRSKTDRSDRLKNVTCYIYNGEKAEAFFNDSATISVMHENKIVSFYQPEGESHVILHWTSGQDQLETETFTSLSALKAKIQAVTAEEGCLFTHLGDFSGMAKSRALDDSQEHWKAFIEPIPK